MADESQFPYQTEGRELISSEFGLVEEKNGIYGSSIDGVTDSLADQGQLNQVETSEASYQTKSGGGGGRAKLTLVQKRENKRLSDCKYRQKRKMIADEQAAEIKHLKEENERLNAENTRLKQQMAPLRLDSFITQSTGKQLEHQSVSLQLCSLQTNELKNQQLVIPVNVVASNDYVAENQKNSQAGTCCNDDTPTADLLMKIDAYEESKVKFSDFTG